MNDVTRWDIYGALFEAANICSALYDITSHNRIHLRNPLQYWIKPDIDSYYEYLNYINYPAKFIKTHRLYWLWQIEFYNPQFKLSEQIKNINKFVNYIMSECAVQLTYSKKIKPSCAAPSNEKNK